MKKKNKNCKCANNPSFLKIISYFIVRFCRKCSVLKDKDTVHCDSCDVCIRGYDHHCPWTGKCIGRGNLMPFNLFLGMTFFFMAYAIIVSVLTLLPPNQRSMRKSV